MSDRFEPDAALKGWLRRLPHYQYLAELVAGKRVLEVECGTGFGARFVANLGARRVLGIDRSAEAIDEAAHRHSLTNLEFRTEDLSALELEDGSFDVVLVPDGAPLLRRKLVLDELRRVLAREGCLVFAAESSDRPTATGGASYFDIVDRLQPLFAPVRMAAQTPFTGVSLVEYTADEAPPAAIELDASLLELAARPDEDVVGYLAVCGPGAERWAGQLTIVQLPSVVGAQVLAASVSVPVAGADEPTVVPAVAGDARARERLATHGVAAEREERELRERLGKAIEERDALRRRAAALKEQLEEAQQETGRVAAEAGIELGVARRDVAAMRRRMLELEAQIALRESEQGAAGGPRRDLVGAALAAEFDHHPGTVEILDVHAVRSARAAPEPAPEPVAEAAPEPAPTASEQIAVAMQAHAAVVRQLEEVIDERAAYIDELREEQADADAALAEAEARARDLAARLDARAAELREWRSRASTAEGELLAARRAAAATAGEREPPPAVPSAGDDVLSAQVAELRRELAMSRTELALARSSGEVGALEQAAASAIMQELQDAKQEIARLRAELEQRLGD